MSAIGSNAEKARRGPINQQTDKVRYRATQHATKEIQVEESTVKATKACTPIRHRTSTPTTYCSYFHIGNQAASLMGIILLFPLACALEKLNCYKNQSIPVMISCYLQMHGSINNVMSVDVQFIKILSPPFSSFHCFFILQH